MPLRDSGLLASSSLAISAPSLEPFYEHAFGRGDCFLDFFSTVYVNQDELRLAVERF